MDLTINKVAAGVVGLAMVAGLAFAFTATRVHATTLSELVELFIALEVIAPDKADEARAALENMDVTTPATPGVSMSCNFTRDLAQGDTGADVMDLQELLNASGFTVSVTGAGSPGMETEYYGPATAGAVAKMQEAYASEILTPLGLTAGTGYFGASTREKANELCAADAPDVPAVPGDDDEDMDDEDNDLSGGEASLEDFDASSEPSDEELEEGAEDQEVYGFEFDVEDADVEVNRVDIRFEMTGTSAEDDPWNVFDEVSLWYDGEEVGRLATDDEDDWGNETGDAFSLRFTGLDVVIEEGELAEFVVAVSTMNIDDGDIDGADEMEWSVWVEANGVRATDGADLDQYTGDADELTDADHEETFVIEVAGGDTELKLSTASANPDSSIIKVEENDRSDEVAVLVLDAEAEDGEVTLNKLVFFATTSDEDLIDVISDITLDINGDTFSDWYYAETAGGVADTDPDESGYIVFNLEDEDDEYTIEEDDEVEIKLLVEFKQVSGNYAEGTTVEFDVASTELDEWLADDVNGDDLDDTTGKSGTANGEAHQLLSAGIFAEIVSVDESSKSDGTNDDAVGEFEIKFDVTAFDETYYISATTTTVFSYTIEDSNGTAISTTTSAAISSTATRQGDSFRIDEGDTETFTLTVTVDPDVADYYRAQLNSIDFGTSETNTTNETAHTVAPTEDFETGNIYLNA